MEPMEKTLAALAENIVWHYEQMFDADHDKHVEMTRSILERTLHAEGFVRLENITQPKP